jgi:hypothetical protein
LPISDSDIVSLPDVALSPLQFPDAEQVSALVVDQVKVNSEFTSTLSIIVDRVTVGEGKAGGGDASTLLLLPPPHPGNTVRNNKLQINRKRLLNILIIYTNLKLN